MKLYNYWRSGTSHRTRIALALKDIAYEYVPVDLRIGQQASDIFMTMNPQGLVPSLELADGTILSQSPAILEFLEERYPTPSLLAGHPVKNAEIRRRAAIIGCDIHPLNNLRILKYLKSALAQDQTAVDGWISRWITEGFTALENILCQDSQKNTFCFGESPTLADCYLIPQIYSAKRFNVDLSPFPRLLAIDETCHAIAAFQQAHPDQQPDAD